MRRPAAQGFEAAFHSALAENAGASLGPRLAMRLNPAELGIVEQRPCETARGGVDHHRPGLSTGLKLRSALWCLPNSPLLRRLVLAGEGAHHNGTGGDAN